MPEGSGNIFLTTENLAFSMPLILVCTIYVYFKFIPLRFGLPLIGGVALLLLIRAQMKAMRNKRVTSMDDRVIKDLLAQEEENDKSKEEAEAKQRKAKNKVQARLAQERKAEARKVSKKKKNSKDEDADDDDVDALMTFAKAPKPKKN